VVILTKAELEELDIDPLVVPRPRRKAPRRFDDGADPVRFESPKQMFHQRYYEIIDHAESAIRRRFKQPGIDLECANSGEGICQYLYKSCTL